jgi:hypothetical protein
MFEPTSRYITIETAQLTTPDGRVVSYKRRRFLPQGKDLPLLGEVTVGSGERLDVLTARALDDPEQFWRICDANDAMRPDELTAEPGRTLRVSLPQPS